MKGHDMSTDTSKRIPEDFRIVDHGPDGASYFPGHGVSFTNYKECATGAGHSPAEALDDALEQLACGGWDVSAIEACEDAADIRANPKTVHDWHDCGKTGDEEEDQRELDACDHYWYVSVDVR